MAVCFRTSFYRLILRRSTRLPKYGHIYYDRQGNQFIAGTHHPGPDGQVTIVFTPYRAWRKGLRL